MTNIVVNKKTDFKASTPNFRSTRPNVSGLGLTIPTSLETINSIEVLFQITLNEYSLLNNLEVYKRN